MDFSWFGVTVVDVGVVSVSVIGFAWLFGRIAALEKQLAVQKQEHEREIATLKQEHETGIATLKQEHEKEFAALKEENSALRSRIETLRSRIETLEAENRALQKSFDILSGRYAEIKEVLSIFLKDESLRNRPTA